MSKDLDELTQLLKTSRLSDALSDHLLKLGIESVADFVGLVNSQAYESELKTLIVDKSACKDDLVQLSRLRNAWREAQLLVDKSRKRRLEGIADDCDDPLDSGTQENLLQSFQAMYGVKLNMHLTPSDALLGRVYREFTRNAPTVIPAKKIMSLYKASAGASRESVSLGSNIMVQVSSEPPAIKTVIAYYWSLRVLANAYALAGTHKVQSVASASKQVTFAPLDVNVQYADYCLRQVTEVVTNASQQLAWLQSKDENTRACMVEFMRQGQSQGEALQNALTRAEVAWVMPASLPVAVDKSQPDSPEGRLRKKERTLRVLPSGQMPCKRYNDQRGCASNEKQCPDKRKHCCDVVKPDGQACLPCPVLGIVESASVDPRWVDSVSPNMVPLLPGPFRTEAAEFGHVDDPKLWSCFANQPLLHPMAHVQMPNVRVELTLQAVALKFQGKQCPKTVFFQDGFVKSSSKLFAPLLQHGLAQVPAPMLQKQGAQRQATLAELAHMYCIPAALAAVVPPSIIRSATHLPSLAMVVCILLKSLHCDKQVVPFPWYEPQEDKLRQLVAGTVFQPGLCDSFPGTLTAAEVADRALHRCSLEGVYFSRSASDLRSALARVPLAALQLFWVHAQLMGLPGHVQGPDWAQQKAPSASALAIGSQRGSGLSRFALCPLHPSGLSKEQHIAASAQVASPFASACILDEDLQFVCQLLVTYGPYVRQWRLDQLKIMRKLAKVLQPWEAECAGCMPPSVQRVAAAKKPMFMLVCSILLRWPDETNALRYVTGYRIVGDIECSGLFRPLDVDRSQSTGTDVLFGKPHNLWAMRQRVKPGQHDAELASMTRQEILDGFAEGVFTQDELDERFGVGLWRPLERFIHVQSCGKLRCIDSGKKSGHNAASRESETIYTTTVDVVPVVVRRAWEMIWQFWAADSSCLPEWCDFVLGTEDMKNAYRQCPVHPQHRSCSTIAFWDHEVNDIRFVVLDGLPFGLSSSVLNFNRTPALLTAVARRFCGCAVAHFFDDSGIVDLSCSNGLAQAIVREVYALAGAHLDPAKSQSPAGCRTFLGLSVNVALAATAGVVEVDLKPGFRETIKAEIESVLESSTLTSGQAAKLRGKFGWAASGTYGKCGRGGQAPLVQRQYFDHSDFLTSSLRDALNFHLLLATFVGPKQIAVFNEPMPPIRIYSDASYEPEADVVAGIGFVLFDAASSRPPIGMAASLDPE
ncbi:TauD domain-containing protein, partial [Durusdinium trenchii]